LHENGWLQNLGFRGGIILRPLVYIHEFSRLLF